MEASIFLPVCHPPSAVRPLLLYAGLREVHQIKTTVHQYHSLFKT